MDAEEKKDIIRFIEQNSRKDLRLMALDVLLGLSGSDAGNEFLITNSELLTIVLKTICQENEDHDVSTKALNVILSLSSNIDLCKLVLSNSFNTVDTLFKNLFTTENKIIADLSCKVLCNLTREEETCTETWKKILKVSDSSSFIEKISDIFKKISRKENREFLEYAPMLLSNLTQLIEVRGVLKEEDFKTIKLLLPLLMTDIALILKIGIAGVVRNCCFDTDLHEALLKNDLEVLTGILLPLAGNEEFTDKENDELPIDLQYLPDDKKREEDASVRRLLIEALTQLCATKYGRKYLRDNGVYYIMRELFNWEKIKEVEVACHNVIDILIKEEHEQNVDNLKDLKIPDEMSKEFNDIDEEMLQKT